MRLRPYDKCLKCNSGNDARYCQCTKLHTGVAKNGKRVPAAKVPRKGSGKGGRR